MQKMSICSAVSQVPTPLFVTKCNLLTWRMNILYAVCLAMYLGVLTYKSSKAGKYCKSQPNGLHTDVTVALETCTLYNLALIKLQVLWGKM